MSGRVANGSTTYDLLVAAPVVSTGCAVGIDLGTSNTVAILRWADGRTRPLLVEGRPVLPSGVFVDGTGARHAGRDAERMAQLDPAGYEPNPKRRVDDGSVLLGGRELPVAELLATVLRAVATAATEAVGFLPAVVVTYPASWGSLRRGTLQEAVGRAGWPQVRLLPEPVAAARYFTDVLRRPMPPGATIAVFDFGGGTFDVALVRREDPGFTVIGWGGAEDLGGLDIDAALVGYLGQQLERDHPEAWRQISQPVEEIDRRHRRQFWEEVRSAKEMLSRTTAAAIAVPGVNASLHITRDELEALARPLVKRCVTELTDTVERSQLTMTDLSEVFLVGGTSRMPLVASMLHTELGIAPTVLEQPELPVVEGALADLVAASAPAPPTTPPVAAAPVAAAPVSAGPVPPPLAATAPKRKRRYLLPVLLLVLALVAGCVGGAGYLVYRFIKPRSTFQELTEAQTIPVDGMNPNAFTTTFLTDQKAHVVAQVGRQVDVTTFDRATKVTKHQRTGDAGRWSQALLFGDVVVVIAEPERGKRQLVGVNNADNRVWSTVTGADGQLLSSHNLETTDGGAALLWFDRQTNKISALDPRTGKPYPYPRALPANWRLLGADGGLAAVVAGGAVWDTDSEDQPTKIVGGIPDRALLGALNNYNEVNVVYALPQDEYAVMSTATLKPETLFRGPANRNPVWIGGCQPNNEVDVSSDVCVIDQIGKDPATREAAAYTPLGTPHWRVSAPYADAAEPPQLFGQDEESYVVVSTLRDKERGAIVLSGTGEKVGTYPGQVFSIDGKRALIAAPGAGAGAEPVTFKGLDLKGEVVTELGTQTVRAAGCSWTDTSLLCPGPNNFTLWRFAK